MFLKYFIIISVLFSMIFGDDLNSLLEVYKKEAELSKITKKESAGFVDIFTRDDLEKMQAHNLKDILKVISGLYLQQGINGSVLLAKPTIYKIPFSMIRLYINDHDMSSSTFNSAFLIWGDMPIEYIDHIEVYKATSSIEFGNETTILILKLYTKLSTREKGSKARLMIGDNGSYDAGIYSADKFENGMSYFVYANFDNLKNDTYSKNYNNKEYFFDNDKKGYNFYANINYKDCLLEAGNYNKNTDDFIGRGINQTPDGGGLDANQFYIHLTQKFDYDFKLQLSYDEIDYDRSYYDENGIRGANLPMMDGYTLGFEDNIYSIILDKTIKYKSNKIILGGFYKRKKAKEKALFKEIDSTNLFFADFSNALDLYSIYMEDTYSFNTTTTFIASIKSDSYRYDTTVKEQNKLVYRVGGIKKFEKLMFKLFYIDTFMPLAFYETYNPSNLQLKSNPNLNPTDVKIFSISAEYKDEKNILKLILNSQKINNMIKYIPSTPYGFVNLEGENKYERLEAKYRYNFDLNNRLDFAYFIGKNNLGVVDSPKYGINLSFFNKYKKFDFYNEFLYRPSYEYAGSKLDASLDFISSIKYHYSKDLSLGFRGDNIFNKGYEQAYRGVSDAIPVTQQRFWLNVEYLF